MNNDPFFDSYEPQATDGHQPIIVIRMDPDMPPRWAPPPPPPVRRRRRVVLPLVLFLATCFSTFLGYFVVSGSSSNALVYAISVMTILVCHEAGHFIQAWRYRVYASLPYFIPMPITPLGTLGAVIGMEARVGDRKAIFDIGISGPLAGLVPTLICTIIGIGHMADLPAAMPQTPEFVFGAPLLFRWIEQWMLGVVPPGLDITDNPIAFAGWVGLLITSLNLMPIGQLDGGHILYGLLRRRAHTVSWMVLLGGIAAMVIFNAKGWIVMAMLLLVIGPQHPPTANDDVPLGPFRVLLGWLTLAFVLIGFTPWPLGR
jgi:membrane-associated protease RseP (regulator of RpoE activity)